MSKPYIQMAIAAIAISGMAVAAPISISPVPIMNMSGAVPIPPNIMLMYDNSGSMRRSYTPDYVNDSLCRSRTRLKDGTTSCEAGMPPYYAPAFNKQFYNPAVSYTPPPYHNYDAADPTGTSYPSQTSAATSGWKTVDMDGFNKNLSGFSESGGTASTFNLLEKFPEKLWCNKDNSSDCKSNTSYAYPTDQYRTEKDATGAPFYYTIAAGEYCKDESLRECKSVALGSAAPTGYPVKAEVRWCKSASDTDVPNDTSIAVDLGNPTCQALYTSTYKYPRFSVALAQRGYGTITIGASTTSNASLSISQVVAQNGASTTMITSGAVSAPTGTTTPALQQQIATKLASSINGKSTTPQFAACVKSPSGIVSPAVSACSTYGIDVSDDNVVAVFPATCTGAKPTTCTPLSDGTAAGWTLAPTSPLVTITPAVPGSPLVGPTGFVTITGTSSSSNKTSSRTTIASISYGGTSLSGFPLTFGKSRSASQMASDITGAIGTSGAIKAYIGGNTVTPSCAAKPNTTVCLVESSGTTNGKAVTIGSVTNPASATFTGAPGVGYTPAGTAVAAVTDTIPVTGSTITSGASAPSPFVRVDLVSGQTYPKHTNRSDCTTTAGVCTYEEEMTNMANWWAYYRTRNQTLKSAVGAGFVSVSDRYRVGLGILSNLAAESAIDIKPAAFKDTHRQNWYTKLYGIDGSDSTPLRTALDSLGKMFQNAAPYNYSSGSEVIQYPCQQNFVIMTTDGYWNQDYSGSATNNDNTESESRFCSLAKGCLDQVASPAEAPSLADVALYWYNGGSNGVPKSLRPDIDNVGKVGMVPSNQDDPNTHLHVTTFTLGLGVSGYVAYEKNYDKSPRVGGDFYNITHNVSTGCPWNSGGRYTWPDPLANSQKNVDDLWHAAINGHGKYFNASEPKEIQQGFQEALGAMQVREGAASAASTSTPNVSKTDNAIFSATFTTVKWYGELYAQEIDVATGEVKPAIIWRESDQLGLKVGNTSDTRDLLWLKSGSLVDFTHANMTSTEKAWFDNKCSSMAQCASMGASDRDIANNGANLVSWLRGQQVHANDTIYRAYSKTSGASIIPIVLGDIDNAKPAYLRQSRKAYPFNNYSTFKEGTNARVPMVFAAANDGILHAFNANTGDEVWGYLPRITMPRLHKLASTGYGADHTYTVDGSPETADVQIGGVWKTVLVGGLNAGGRGFYALDVTDPQNPVGMWELCADAGVCSKSDGDIGLTYGNPQFGKFNGEWVVFLTSGYNNVPDAEFGGGDGQGYLYIVRISDGTIIRKVGTGAGDATTPAGLGRITAVTANPQTDPVVTQIYGGDNLGNVWRFDLTAAPAITTTKLAALGGDQPVTARPEVVLCSDGTNAVKTIAVGTGRLLGVPDTSNTDTQSVYVFRDKGALLDLRGSTMVKRTLADGATAGTYTVSASPVDLAVKDGWYMDLDKHEGERINLDPKVYFGALDMISNVPTSNTDCNIGGVSYTYQLDVCKGTALSSNNVVASLLSNTSAAVGFITIRLPSGAIKNITTTAEGKKVTSNVKTLGSMTARKSGWRKVK